MAQDKEIYNASVDDSVVKGNLVDTFVESYKTVFNIESKIDKLESLASSIIPNDFNVCDIPKYMENAQSLVEEVSSIPSELINALNVALGAVNDELLEEVEEIHDKIEENVNNTIDEIKSKLKIPYNILAYSATAIILKRFQIIQHRIKIIQLSIQLRLSELRKKILLGILNGKDDSGSDISTPIKQFILGVGMTANVISNVVSTLLKFIESFNIMNIDGAGCAFGPTPKNLMKSAKMIIANTRSSTTNTIPEEIDIAITEAENKLKETYAESKKAKLISMSASSSAKVASGEDFSVEAFGSLPKFDGSIIRETIKAILQLILDAEALPRYEKLSISNLRFLVFLTTGFEPAAKKSFGIPGFP